MQHWRVTYTKDGHKKLRHNRKWLDGFLAVRQSAQGVSAVLLAEDGSEVSSSRVPPGVEIGPDGDELTCFGAGVLVVVDCACSAQEAPGGGGGTAAPAAVAGRRRGGPPPAAAAAAEDENAPAAANRQLPPALPKLSGAAWLGGRKGGFVPPRVAARPPQPAAAPDFCAAAAPSGQQPEPPQVAHATSQHHRQQHGLAGQQHGSHPAEACQRGLLQGSRQPHMQVHPGRPADAAGGAAVGGRTNDDILRLLLGGQPAAERPAAQAPAAAALAQPQEVPRPPLASREPAQPAQPKRWAGYEQPSTQHAPHPASAAVGSRWAPGPAMSAGLAASEEKPWGLAGMVDAGDTVPPDALMLGDDDLQPWRGERPAATAAPAAGGGNGAAGHWVQQQDTQQRQQQRQAPQPAHRWAGPQGNVADEQYAAPAAPRFAQQASGSTQQQAGAAAEERAGLPPTSKWATHMSPEPTGPAAQLRQKQQQQQQTRPAVPEARGFAPPTSGWAPPQQLAQPRSLPSQPGGVGATAPPQQPLGFPHPAPNRAAGAGQNSVARPGAPSGQLFFAAGTEGGRLARRVVVPDSFSSGEEYSLKWRLAIMEELNLKLSEVAQSFHSVSQTLHSGKQPAAGGMLETRLRQRGVFYHGNCELFVWKNLPKKQQGGKRGWKLGKGRAGDEDEDAAEEEEDAAAKKPESFYLIIKSGRGRSSDYRKDDLWVVSNTPQFQSGYPPGQVGDRARAPWVAIARSLWHGPNQDGKFEVEFLSARPPGLGRSQPVFAIRGPEASTELSMAELLQGITPQALPLLPHILGRPAASAAAAGALPGRAPSAAAGLGTPLRPLQGGAAAGPSGGDGSPGSPPSPSYSPTDSERSRHSSKAPAVSAGEPAAEAAAEEYGRPPQTKRAKRGAGGDDSSDLQSWRRRGGTAGAASAGVGGPEEEEPGSCNAAEDVEALIARFRLNEEQAHVVRHVANWCGSMGAQTVPPQPPPICLIHGPFGSGKSTLLVAILHLLLQQRAKRGSPLAGGRVLVSAHTNVAVDRVLLGLLESGCTDFLRMGPLRRISRGLLRQALHCSESKAHASAASELRDMLKEATDPHEQAVLRAELKAAEKGAERQKKRLLKTVPIVGVTCCSALLSALDGQRFDMVVLDECSQMVEPLSMVPLLRASCRYLIAAGDPLQLPPVIALPAQVTPPPGTPAGAPAHGLLRPLFVRLAALGHAPHLLRRQYRCHPDLSLVPNQQFYNGRLLDGVAAADRPSLLPGLPALVFLDVRGSEQYSQGSRSVANPQEAAAVLAVVQRLLEAGAEQGQIGIICLFRAQVALVQSMLGQQLPGWLEAQQQRRRAAAEAESWGAEPAAALRGGSAAGCDLQMLGSSDGEEEDAGEASGEREEAPRGIQVATVDSFQGAERDVIILSTAVTRPGSFAADACRLNVALTRARRNLVLVGCAPALQKSSPAFAALLRKCRSTPGGYSPHGRLPAAVAAGMGGGGGHAAEGLPPQAAAAAVQPLPGPSGTLIAGQVCGGRGAGGAAAQHGWGAMEEDTGDVCEEDWAALEAAMAETRRPPAAAGPVQPVQPPAQQQQQQQQQQQASLESSPQQQQQREHPVVARLLAHQDALPHQPSQQPAPQPLLPGQQAQHCGEAGWQGSNAAAGPAVLGGQLEGSPQQQHGQEAAAQAQSEQDGGRQGSPQQATSQLSDGAADEGCSPGWSNPWEPEPAFPVELAPRPAAGRGHAGGVPPDAPAEAAAGDPPDSVSWGSEWSSSPGTAQRAWGRAQEKAQQGARQGQQQVQSGGAESEGDDDMPQFKLL